LSWSFEGNEKVKVPSSQLYAKKYISTPTTVLVEYEEAQVKEHDEGKRELANVCGDGMRHNTEE